MCYSVYANISIDMSRCTIRSYSVVCTTSCMQVECDEQVVQTCKNTQKGPSQIERYRGFRTRHLDSASNGLYVQAYREPAGNKVHLVCLYTACSLSRECKPRLSCTLGCLCGLDDLALQRSRCDNRLQVLLRICLAVLCSNTPCPKVALVFLEAYLAQSEGQLSAGAPAPPQADLKD